MDLLKWGEFVARANAGVAAPYKVDPDKYLRRAVIGGPSFVVEEATDTDDRVLFKNTTDIELKGLYLTVQVSTDSNVKVEIPAMGILEVGQSATYRLGIGANGHIRWKPVDVGEVRFGWLLLIDEERR